MNMKNIFIVLLAIVVLITGILTIRYIRAERLINFSEVIESGNVDDLSLTIYYLSFLTFTTPALLSIDELVGGWYDHRIVVDGNSLEEHIDLLEQIDDAALIPVAEESRIRAVLYYVFENNQTGETFSVALYGRNESMFVNGIEVEANNIFYDVIIPFLPERAIEDLETIMNREK